MKRKLFIGILIASIMLTSIVPAFAYVRPGATEYVFSADSAVEFENVSLSQNTITVSGDGYVRYDYFTTLDAAKMEIQYKDATGASVTVEPDGNKAKTFAMTGEDTITYTFPAVQHSGDNYLTLRFTGNVMVTSVKLIANVLDGYTNYNRAPVALTENEKAIQAEVLVKTDSSVFMVNGAKRYINLEDINEKPMEFDGRVYLPIKTLALALGYYHESMPDKNYCLLRLEQLSFIYRDGQMVRQDKHDEPVEADAQPKLINGNYYMPLRYFAEAIGKTVAYKDGLIVIGSRNRTKDILESSAVRSYIAEQLAPGAEEKIAGNTYYVAQSKNANDGNAGTAEAPFKTLAKAASIAKAGDTVIVREGIYRETLTPQNDGTEASPIVFRAADGESVTISAAEAVTEFAEIGDGKVAASVPWTLGAGRDQVFYKDGCLIEARHPNGPRIEMSENGEQLSNLFPVMGDLHMQVGDSTLVKSDTLLNQEDDYWKGATFVTMHGKAWTLGTAHVKSSTKGELRLTDLPFRFWHTARDVDFWSWGYLSGHKNCLDAPGEWIMEHKMLVMIPPEGETAKTLKAEVKKRQTVINLNNRKSVHIEGMKTVGGSVTMVDSEFCMLKDMDMSYIGHYTYSENQREGIIDNGEMADVKENPSDTSLHRGESGIYVAGFNNHIVNSKIDHSAAAGIILTGAYAYIENNIISNCGYMGSYTSGITVTNQPEKAKDAKRGGFAIYNNTVYNCGRSCFNLQNFESYWGSGILQFLPYEMAYNDFHDGLLFSLDGGITYEYTMSANSDVLNTRMHNNYLYYTRPETNPFSMGLYHDGNTEGIDTFDNIIFTTEEGTMFTNSYMFINPTLSPNNAWNNQELKNDNVAGGPENLRVDQYPYGLPFYAGSKLDSEPFMKNYEADYNSFKLIKPTYAKSSAEEDIEVTDTVILPKKGDYVVFENVDFGQEELNTFQLYIRGDRFPGERRKIQIGFGTTREDADVYDCETLVRADISDKLAMFNEFFNAKEGVMNVYVENTGTIPVTIDGITFKHCNIMQKEHDPASIPGGTFDRVVKSGGTKANAVFDNISKPHVKDVWDGTILRYEKVQMPVDAKVFYVNVGVSGAYHGQEIVFSYNVIGESDNVEFARVITTNNGWDTKDDTQYVVLKNPIPSDAPLDIYVEFRKGTNEAAGTCNLFEFGFINEIPAAKQ
ncbi:MAG: DUF1565 domain-containing protein [Clostridia bacterium]|nr:DUF1565 domain-containing protein [Clostridia bacterium]